MIICVGLVTSYKSFNHSEKFGNNTMIIILGNMRRFRRICEHTQSVVSVIRRPPPPSSPRAQRRVTSGPTVVVSSGSTTTSNATNMIIGGKSSAARVPVTG